LLDLRVAAGALDITGNHIWHHEVSLAVCGGPGQIGPIMQAPDILGFDHLTFPVHDLDAAERFYVGVLGARVLRRFDRATFQRYRPERAHESDAENSPLHLALAFHGTPELHLFVQKNRCQTTPAPHPHLAMAVDADALDVFIERLQRAGVPIDGPRRLGPPGHASVYFADPFGNTLELVTHDYHGDVQLGPPDVTRLGW
jgi:catechol 2,3-dioxygenase-like lactoylglutathione lyase family enzyme